MQIRFFCPFWGFEGMEFERYCEQVALAGYDGVEMNLSYDDTQNARNLDLLKQFQLAFLGQHSQTYTSDFTEHLKQYEYELRRLAEVEPILINSQTGKDWFSFELNQRLILLAQRIAEETDVKIIHEMHRGKFSFCGTALQPFLDKNPGLRITADFSHWCTVSESLLADQPEAVASAIERSDHIHARVGHPEGPQVNDPRAPEWGDALEAHLGWWDRIVEYHRQAGSAAVTITPEFGPWPYMPELPYTRQPLTSQREANLHMMNLLKGRWGDDFSA